MTNRGVGYVTMRVRVSRRALNRITTASEATSEPTDLIAARLLETSSKELWPIPQIAELHELHYSTQAIAERLRIPAHKVRRHLEAIKKGQTP